jgi:hypothetical protein
MVRQQRLTDKTFCFDADEAVTLKRAYDDALSKLEASRAALGPSEALASQIVHLAKLRATLGQSLTGYSDAQLLSFLARQSLR